MSESVRKVTELEIRRLLLGFDRSELAVRLELCCDEGGGINARTLRRWRLAVGSVAELGVHNEWIEEVNRRKALEVLGSAGLLLPAQADRRRVAAGGPFPRRHTGDLATATRVATDIAGAYADTPDGQVIRSTGRR